MLYSYYNDYSDETIYSRYSYFYWRYCLASSSPFLASISRYGSYDRIPLVMNVLPTPLSGIHK